MIVTKCERVSALSLRCNHRQSERDAGASLFHFMSRKSRWICSISATSQISSAVHTSGKLGAMARGRCSGCKRWGQKRCTCPDGFKREVVKTDSATKQTEKTKPATAASSKGPVPTAEVKKTATVNAVVQKSSPAGRVEPRVPAEPETVELGPAGAGVH